MKRLVPQSGFTLLELLVTVSIVAGIVAAVLACFEGGFRVYERIQVFGSRETDVYLAGEQIQRDLQNAIAGEGQQFAERQALFRMAKGFEGELVLVQLRAPSDGGLYYWTGMAPVPYGERVGTRLIADDLQVTFAYGRAGEAEAWLPMWEGTTNLPAVVRMRVEDSADDAFRVERTVLLTGYDGAAAIDEEAP